MIEMLHDAGYRTGAWTANLLMRPDRGFTQGFDAYELVMHPEWRFGVPFQGEHSFALADDLSSRALAWLEETSGSEGDAPFFVYLHYMEPHTPFLCPPTTGDACRRAAAALNRRLTQVEWDFTDSQQGLIENFYDADVKRMDEDLGRLYRDLEERGLLENTWLIVTADHGEMLGEHDLYIHGRALYRETVRIPLLVYAPSGNGSVVSSPVSLIDIAPTILDLAGIDAPSSFRGRSLRDALEGRSLPLRPVVAELFPVNEKRTPRHSHFLSITDGEKKLVVTLDGELVRFDLATDPGEAEPISADWGEFEKLLSEVGIEFDRSKALSRDVPELTPETLEHLRSLGYVQ
jgi:arylsulfatase A-like enzyme